MNTAAARIGSSMRLFSPVRSRPRADFREVDPSKGTGEESDGSSVVMALPPCCGLPAPCVMHFVNRRLHSNGTCAALTPKDRRDLRQLNLDESGAGGRPPHRDLSCSKHPDPPDSNSARKPARRAIAATVRGRTSSG